MQERLPEFTLGFLSGYPALVVLLAGCAITLTVSVRPKLFWPLLLIVNIVGNGPKTFGYVVLDEFLTGFLVMGALMRIALRPGARLARHNDAPGTPYLLLLAYLFAQSIAGGIVNDDFRIFRFALLYVMLGLVWFIVSRRSREFPFPSVGRLLYLCSTTASIYWVLYLAQGVISERAAGQESLGRFFTQDSLWAGTAAAVLPIVLGAPAAIFLANRPELRARVTATVGMFLMMSVSFFYYSRMSWLVLLGCLAATFRQIRVTFVVFLLVAFVGAATFWRPSTQDFSALFGELAGTSAALWSPSESDGKSRMLQLRAAADTMMESGKTLLIGEGYYSHRHLMVPKVREALSKHYPDWHDFTSQIAIGGRDIEIIRTTGLSALMVDTGLIGVGLLLWNVALLATRIWRRRSTTSALFVSLAIVTGLWLVVANILDSVLFFVLLMPHGIFDQWSARSAEEFAAQSVVRDAPRSTLLISGRRRMA